SRPMEGYVAPALDLEQPDSARREQLGRREEVPLFARPAQSNHRRVLDKEPHVLLQLAPNTSSRPPPLEVPRLRVVDESARGDPEFTHRVSLQIPPSRRCRSARAARCARDDTRPCHPERSEGSAVPSRLYAFHA